MSNADDTWVPNRRAQGKQAPVTDDNWTPRATLRPRQGRETETRSVSGQAQKPSHPSLLDRVRGAVSDVGSRVVQGAALTGQDAVRVAGRVGQGAALSAGDAANPGGAAVDAVRYGVERAIVTHPGAFGLRTEPTPPDQWEAPSIAFGEPYGPPAPLPSAIREAMVASGTLPIGERLVPTMQPFAYGPGIADPLARLKPVPNVRPATVQEAAASGVQAGLRTITGGLSDIAAPNIEGSDPEQAALLELGMSSVVFPAVLSRFALGIPVRVAANAPIASRVAASILQGAEHVPALATLGATHAYGQGERDPRKLVGAALEWGLPAWALGSLGGVAKAVISGTMERAAYAKAVRSLGISPKANPAEVLAELAQFDPKAMRFSGNATSKKGQQIRSWFRKTSANLHPDRGGSPGALQAFREDYRNAWETAQNGRPEWFRNPRAPQAAPAAAPQAAAPERPVRALLAGKQAEAPAQEPPQAVSTPATATETPSAAPDTETPVSAPTGPSSTPQAGGSETPYPLPGGGHSTEPLAFPEAPVAPVEPAATPALVPFEEYVARERARLQGEYPDADPATIESSLPDLSKWERLVEQAGSRGRIPDAILDDYRARFGANAFGRVFRGVAEQDGYLPPEVRNAPAPVSTPAAPATPAREPARPSKREMIKSHLIGAGLSPRSKTIRAGKIAEEASAEWDIQYGSSQARKLAIARYPQVAKRIGYETTPTPPDQFGALLSSVLEKSGKNELSMAEAFRRARGAGYKGDIEQFKADLAALGKDSPVLWRSTAGSASSRSRLQKHTVGEYSDVLGVRKASKAEAPTATATATAPAAVATPAAATAEPAFMRTTPVKGTPERDAIKVEHDQAQAQIEELRAKRERARSPKTKDSLDEQITTATQRQKQLKADFRRAYLEDVIESGDEINRISAQMELDQLNGKKNGPEVNRKRYDRQKELAIEEARRQGVPEPDQEYVAGQALNMISGYPGMRSLPEQIDSEVRLRASEKAKAAESRALEQRREQEKQEREAAKRAQWESEHPETVARIGEAAKALERGYEKAPGGEQSYYMRVEGDFGKVKGEPVAIPGLEDADLFIANQGRNSWSVVDAVSGLPLASGGTKAEAIQKATSAAERMLANGKAPIDRLRELSESSIKEGGISPRYRAKVTPAETPSSPAPAASTAPERKPIGAQTATAIDKQADAVLTRANGSMAAPAYERLRTLAGANGVDLPDVPKGSDPQAYRDAANQAKAAVEPFIPKIGGAGSSTSAASLPSAPGPTASTAPATPAGAVAQRMLQFHPMPGPELLDLAVKLLGKYPDVKRMGRALGRFSWGKGTEGMALSPELGKDPIQFARVLAHEIGHLVDYLPDRTMARGNIHGHIATLNRYLKTTIDRLPKTPSEALTPKDRAALRRQARRELGKDAKPDEVAARYQELVAQEIQARGLVTRDQVMEELWSLSQWWKPLPDGADDNYLAYRQRPAELYADGGSVFLNAPDELAQRAPLFNTMLQSYLGRKPDVVQAIAEVQNVLSGTPEEIAAARDSRVRAGMVGGEIAMRSEKEIAKRSLPDSLAQAFYDQGYPSIKRENSLLRKGVSIPEEESARYALDEMGYRDNPVHIFLSKVQRECVAPAVEVGATQEDLGMYMFYTRIAEGDRSEVLNPYGISADDAAAQLAWTRSTMGDKKYAAIARAVDKFHDLAWEPIEEAAKVGSYSQQAVENIRPNKHTYATFSVVEYLESEYIPAAIKEQVGTLKPVANPFVMTAAKTMALIRLNEFQKAKRVVIDQMEQYFPGDGHWEDAPVTGTHKVGDKEVPTFGEPKKPKPGEGDIVILVDGKPRYFRTDKYTAWVFSGPDLKMITWLTDGMTRFQYKLFHPLFITYNAGFLRNNLFRDLGRTWRNLRKVDASLGEVLSAYWKSLPAGLRRARGVYDADIEKMVEERALDIPFREFVPDDEALAYERMARHYGLEVGNPKKPPKALELVSRLLSPIHVAIDTHEAAAKMAAFRVLEGHGITGKERAYIVRNYASTPNLRRKGMLSRVTNAVFMYSNPMIQGTVADAQVATDPTTASGWWIRSLLVGVLPKVVMRAAAMGLLGASAKALHDNIPDYDKTNYLCVPIGITMEGKTRYLRFAVPEAEQIVGGMAWKAMQGDLTKLAEVTFGYVPDTSPPIQIAQKWREYFGGGNPKDYRGREIIGRDAQKARGKYARNEMFEWTADQFGQVSTIVRGVRGYPGDKRTTTERVVDTFPGIQGFIKTSDRGSTELQWEEVDKEEAKAAESRLKLPENVRRLNMEVSRLERLNTAKQLTLEQNRRYEQLKAWERDYNPVAQAIKAAEARGATQRADALRNRLGWIAARYEVK